MLIETEWNIRVLFKSGNVAKFSFWSKRTQQRVNKLLADNMGTTGIVQFNTVNGLVTLKNNNIDVLLQVD